MIRSQRRRHALTWALLGPTIVALVVIAIFARPQSVSPKTRTTTTGATP